MVTKEEVKASVEYKWWGRQWKLLTGLYVFILIAVLVLTFLTTLSQDEVWSVLGILAVVYGVVFIPFVLFYIWRQWELVHRCDNYEKYQVKLDQPATSRRYRSAVFYHVLFRDNAGNWVRLDTRPLFQDGAFSVCSLEEYNNQTVEIFYDSEKERVIVSKLV